MPRRWCIEPGCRALFDADSTGTLRCPACQAAATARRNSKPQGPGYDGEYQRNRPLVVQRGRAGEPCFICGGLFSEDQKVTVEHKIPRRDGGTSHIDNLAPAHSWCNTAWNRRR